MAGNFFSFVKFEERRRIILCSILKMQPFFFLASSEVNKTRIMDENMESVDTAIRSIDHLVNTVKDYAGNNLLPAK